MATSASTIARRHNATVRGEGANAIDFAHCMGGNQTSTRVLPVELRIGQVVQNLIANEADAFAEADARANRVTVRASRGESDTMLVEVFDNGLGMSPEVVSRIVDPLFTTRPAGVGDGARPLDLPLHRDRRRRSDLRRERSRSRHELSRAAPRRVGACVGGSHDRSFARTAVHV